MAVSNNNKAQASSQISLIGNREATYKSLRITAKVFNKIAYPITLAIHYYPLFRE